MNLVPLTPLGDNFIVEIIERGEVFRNGLIIMDDDFKESGIRPRKAVVLSVGKKIAPDDFKPGDVVLLEHGGWTRNNGLKLRDVHGDERKIWMSNVKFVLGVFPEEG